MKEKLSVAEFATLVGTTAKTIYGRISNNGNLPINEQLETVNEKIKGREVTLILTDTEQINLYKQIYGKNIVNDGEYYENVTVNNGFKSVNNVNEPVKNNDNNAFNQTVIEQLLNVNNDYNNRIERLTNELITAKQTQLLLEYKADREGTYIAEINELKGKVEEVTNSKDKVINSKNKLIKVLITLIITLLMVIITSLTVFITVNNIQNPQAEPPQSEVIE